MLHTHKKESQTHLKGPGDEGFNFCTNHYMYLDYIELFCTLVYCVFFCSVNVYCIFQCSLCYTVGILCM